jgi:hypothetical protein
VRIGEGAERSDDALDAVLSRNASKRFDHIPSRVGDPSEM